MATYSYPHDIRDDKYKHRRVTINVMKPGQQSSVSEAERKALDDLKSAADGVIEAADSVFSIKQNLDFNSKSDEGETLDTLVLPLPNSFSDTQSHGWSLDTGILGSIGKNVTDIDVGAIAGGFLGKVAGKVLGGRGTGIGNITNGLSIDKVLGASTSALGLRKPIVDPGYFQNYGGSEPRAFDMEFDLVPRSAEEAEQIIMIVMKLKQYSSPSRVLGGVSVLAPYYFNISISNDYVKAMSNFDRVVLTNISVDYGADGAMQQHADGVPKYMKLSLSWAEVDMTTAQDYNTIPRK